MRASVLDHLEELRWRLLASLAAIGIVTLIATFFSKPLLDFLITPLRNLGDYTLYFHSPYEGFLTHFKVALLTGVIAASPVIFTELWLFVVPALHRKEKKLIATLVGASVILFLIGAALAFWVIIPWSLEFFLSFQSDSLRPILGVGPYLSFLVIMVLVTGAIFDLPVVLLGLVKAGLVDAPALRKARKAVILSIFILTAVLTPTTDPFTQIFLTAPLILLYEGSVFVAERMKKGKELESSLRG